MSIQRFMNCFPSEDFYAVFHYTKILTLLGCGETIKPEISVRCPKCKVATLRLSDVEPFGVWCYCHKCQISCEPVKLYFEAYKISNPEDGLYRLAEDLEINDLSSDKMVEYLTFYRQYYESIIEFWDSCKKNMYPRANSLASGKLNELNLWRNQELFNRTFKEWFGFCYKSEAEQALNKKIHNIGKCPEGLLVMPFFLKPGLIAGFGFITNKDHIYYVNLADGHTAGFCGLSGCHTSPADKVHIVTHPLQAARIVFKSAIEHYNNISVVAKSPVGKLDVTGFGKKSILWVDGPDPDILKSCIHSHGFSVIQEELPYIWRPQELVSKMWESEFMPSICKRVFDAEAVDPILFFCKSLLDMSVPNARSLVEAIDLNPFQKALVLAACPEDALEQMQDVLSDISDSKPIVIDKKVIFEKDNKLWMQGSRETADELVCDAIVRILHVCRSKLDGAASLFGKMIFEEKEISFQIDEQAFSKEPAKTLIILATNMRAHNQPYLLDSMAKKYLDILFRLSTPLVHPVQEHVGFDQDTGRFSLPRLAIDPQTIHVGVPFVMADLEPPCTNVTLDLGTSVTSIAGVFKHGPETAAYMAAMASIIANIHHKKDTGNANNVFMAGGIGSLAEYIFDAVRLDLGLEKVVLVTKQDFEVAYALATLHDVPVAIDGNKSKPKLLSAWLSGQGLNSFVVADPLQASALALGPNWTFVRANLPFSGETPALIHSENVFPYIMQFSMTVKPGTAKMFLDSLKFFAKSIEAPMETLESAKGLISDKGFINTKSNAAHLINFVLEGVEQGYFKTFTGSPSANSKYVVIKDPANDCVYVNLTNLLANMRQNSIPVVVWEPAVQQLEKMGVSCVSVDSDSLLVFPKPVWNVFVSSVRRMKQLRKAALTNLLNIGRQ